MESQVNWLITFLLLSLFWFYMYLKERRKRKAWQVIVESMQNKAKMLIEKHNQQNLIDEIDNILDDIENNQNKE